MAKLDELGSVLDKMASAIDAAGAQVTHIGTETQALQAAIVELKASLPNPDDQAKVDALLAKAQGIYDATTALGAKLKTVDDLVADAPTAEPAPQTVQPSPSEQQPA